MAMEYEPPTRRSARQAVLWNTPLHNELWTLIAHHTNRGPNLRRHLRHSHMLALRIFLWEMEGVILCEEDNEPYDALLNGIRNFLLRWDGTRPCGARTELLRRLQDLWTRSFRDPLVVNKLRVLQRRLTEAERFEDMSKLKHSSSQSSHAWVQLTVIWSENQRIYRRSTPVQKHHVRLKLYSLLLSHLYPCYWNPSLFLRPHLYHFEHHVCDEAWAHQMTQACAGVPPLSMHSSIVSLLDGVAGRDAKNPLIISCIFGERYQTHPILKVVGSDSLTVLKSFYTLWKASDTCVILKAANGELWSQSALESWANTICALRVSILATGIKEYGPAPDNWPDLLEELSTDRGNHEWHVQKKIKVDKVNDTRVMESACPTASTRVRGPRPISAVVQTSDGSGITIVEPPAEDTPSAPPSRRVSIARLHRHPSYTPSLDGAGGWWTLVFNPETSSTLSGYGGSTLDHESDVHLSLASHQGSPLQTVSRDLFDFTPLSSLLSKSPMDSDHFHLVTARLLEAGATPPYSALQALPEALARRASNVLQAVFDESPPEATQRAQIMRCMRIIADLHSVVPIAFFCDQLCNIEENAVAGGTFSDVYRGVMDGTLVALKVLRFFMSSSDREMLLKDCHREALVWYQLQHPNILPFIGINEVSFFPRFCLVSPWMKNGCIMSFIAKNPTCNRLHCVFDIARGLEFLHKQDPPVVHGDIRGANILVADNGTCCLADFGLSIVEEASSSVYASVSSDGIKGSIRWLPFDSNGESERRRPTRDIYSFGCTIVEIFTGKVPYAYLKKETQVIDAKRNRRQPQMPYTASPRALWSDLVPRYLNPDSQKRPSASTVVKEISILVYT